MKVQMLECLAGTTETLNAGDVVELPDEVAIRFIGAGIATTVEEPKRESATKRPASRAAKE